MKKLSLGIQLLRIGMCREVRMEMVEGGEGILAGFLQVLLKAQ